MDTMTARGLFSGSFSEELIIYIDHSSIDVWEDQVASLLDLGRKYWELYYTKESLIDLIRMQRMQAWIMTDLQRDPYAVVLTSLQVYPKLKALRFEFMSGRDLNKAQKHLPTVLAWGRRLGADIVEGNMRPGMARLAEKHGFKCEAKRMVASLRPEGMLQ